MNSDITSIFNSIDPAIKTLIEQEISEYSRANGGVPFRWQDGIIEEKIPSGSSVLDLGCGKGELLAGLIEKKQVSGQGVELNPEYVMDCVSNSVPVLQADLDEGLRGVGDESFDYVVLEQTLQALHQPLKVLSEMLRVGHCGIVSFPNFAYWKVRLDLLIRGSMPVTRNLPYKWYDTPNIHLFTLQDFLTWTETHGITITEGYVLLSDNSIRPVQDGDNLYAVETLVFLKKKRNA